MNLNMRKNKRYFRALAIIFILFLNAFFLLGIIQKDATFSENENRMLSKIPKLTLDNLSSGRFSKKFEKYCVDQFPFRESLVALKTKTDLLIGKKEQNGVFIASDGYLIEEFTNPNNEAVYQNLLAVNKFTQKYPRISYNFMIVPNASDILSEKLPKNAPVLNQQFFIEGFYRDLNSNINKVELSKTLTSYTENPVFYKTDHHWTSDAAYQAFLKLAASMELKVKEDYYERRLVSDSFLGTLSSKVGYYNNTPDEIYVYLPKTANDEVVVSYIEEKTKSPSLYDTSKLETKNQYELFLKGNHPLVKIKTTAKNTKTLLIIKDSYANCFVPFLTPFFSNIILLDPRYYFEDIYELVELENVTDILYLYNANTFFADTFLADVLNNK